MNDDEDNMIFQFDPNSCPRKKNPNSRPLSVPFVIFAPGLQVPGGKSFSGRMAITEDGDGYGDENPSIGVHIEEMILATFSQTYSNMARSRWPEIMRYFPRMSATIILPTQKGRLLVILFSTQLRDIWEGAKEPGNTTSPFTNLRTIRRAREFEVDGVGLTNGCAHIYVMPSENVADLALSVSKWESAVGALGMDS
ncbi:hypothetical protein HETIRDRAFT_328612 [Heterobasidion irregulare TC 32-1]|uniref:Uncharacterized protein n=1 Tax=Heterobasidion irregulare (strain TC 32-1) TaxID=747525 RepID=W4JTN5_HETIT|nr:uncharacterized protein HETIRDRAFT_328612 [Heterobasidion irregulare TC 32-1]ETW76922.1 hypothetical protein HETIRDRAFT_328612 [Heterobasidion irregulare TC 32-1]